MATPPDFTAGQVLTAAQMNAIGLWEIKSQTIGSAVSSVTVTNAFSADYDKYLITVTGGVGSISAGGSIQFGSTNTGYYWAANYVAYTGSSGVFNGANDTAFKESFYGSASALACCMEVTNPFAAKETLVSWRHGGAATTTVNLHVVGNGYLNNTTSYTAFTITPTGGTLTGGIIRVYGYRN